MDCVAFINLFTKLPSRCVNATDVPMSGQPIIVFSARNSQLPTDLTLTSVNDTSVLIGVFAKPMVGSLGIEPSQSVTLDLQSSPRP